MLRTCFYGFMMLAALGSVAMSPHSPVSLYFNVETGDKLIEGLTADNFRLFQDGKEQTFKLEAPEEPAAVALLVENSVSSSIFYDDIRFAMQGFMDHAPEGNWYALATFNKDLEVQVDFTKHEGKIMDAYSSLGEPLWDETDIYDATYQMLDKMAEMKGRRILIVIASGIDTFSKHSLTDVQKKVESSNVVIYGIGLGSMLRGVDEPYLSTGAQMDLTVARNFLTMLSRESGGEAWLPNEEGAYPSIMDGVMRDIATQYRMVYTPEIADDGKLHAIKVEAYQSEDQGGKEYKVVVRKGWRW